MDIKGIYWFISSYLRSRRTLVMTPEELRKYRSQAFRRFVRRILKFTEFPRSALHGRVLHSPEDLQSLPVFEKKDYLDRFSQWNRFGLSEAQALKAGEEAEASRIFTQLYQGVSIGLSSGTSDRRGIFLTSPRERAEWAGAVLARFLPNFWKKPQRIALFLRSNSVLYESLGSKFVSFRYFDMLRPVKELFMELIRFNPTVLFAPPSLLEGLALMSGASPAFKLGELELVISGAEVLELEVAERVRKVFGCDVRQIYQATEGFLAFTCSQGNLHLNEDLLIVDNLPLESQDSTGRFFPVITDLRRTSQPVLRYRLNDILTPGVESCPCGCSFRVIARIEGREDDVFVFPCGEEGKLRALFPDFIRRAFLEAGYSKFRLEQTSLNKVIIWAEGDTKMAVSVFQSLLDSMKSVPADIEVLDYEPPPAGRKFRRVARTFPLPALFWESQ